MSPDRGLQDPRFYHSAVLLRDLEGPVDRGGQIVTAKDNDCHGITSRFCRRSCSAGVCSPFACKSGGMKRFLFHICILMFLFNFLFFLTSLFHHKTCRQKDRACGEQNPYRPPQLSCLGKLLFVLHGCLRRCLCFTLCRTLLHSGFGLCLRICDRHRLVSRCCDRRLLIRSRIPVVIIAVIIITGRRGRIRWIRRVCGFRWVCPVLQCHT